MSFSKTCSYDVADSFTFIKELPTEKGFSTFFWYLYQNRICTDVKFLLETDYGYKEFQAHKLILSMMSPHFAEKFYKEGKCSKKMEEIVLQKVDPEAFEAMLRFMYKGSITLLDSPEQACALYKVAAEFDVPSLVVKCNEYLHQTEPEPSNVFTFLEVAECMQNRSLIDRCLALIQGRTREIMNSYPLSDINPFMVHVILDQPSLSLTSEYELLKWVFAWAELKASQENSKYRNMREVLQKFLPRMHFLRLAVLEFAEFCRDYDDFFNNDEIANILMNIAFPGSRAMPDWYDKVCNLRVYPEQDAKSKQERVEESCFGKSHGEDSESKENRKEPRDQPVKSEEKKSEQNESEEADGQQSSKKARESMQENHHARKITIARKTLQETMQEKYARTMQEEPCKKTMQEKYARKSSR